MKSFLYLFQVPQDLPPALEQVASADGDILFLSWRAKSRDPRSIFYPASSWTQGRNRLLKEALGRPYRFFVFADGDVDLRLTPGRRARRSAANPWRVFEDFLRVEEPAVGCANYCWHLQGGALDLAQDVQTIRFCDALLNAFHHEAVVPLLPYYDLLDAQSECYSQSLLCSLAADVYPGRVLQTNAVTVANTQSARGDVELLLTKPEGLYLESLRDPAAASRFRRQMLWGFAQHPTMGPVRQKPPSYRVSEQLLASCFRLDHDIWVRKRQLLAMPVDSPFFSESGDTERARAWQAVKASRQRPVPVLPPVASSVTRRVVRQARASLRRWYRLTHPLRSKFGLVRSTRLALASRLRVARLRVRNRLAWNQAALWRKWVDRPDLYLEIPGDGPPLTLDLISHVLNRVPGRHVVVVDVGTGSGEVLGAIEHQTSLTKPVQSIGFDPVQTRGFPWYSGYVLCGRMTGPCSLETVLTQYGLAEQVLHYVTIDAPGRDLDVFRGLGAMVDQSLFLSFRAVAATTPPAAGRTPIAAVRQALTEGGFRVLSIGSCDDPSRVEVTFVNMDLLRSLLPRPFTRPTP